MRDLGLNARPMSALARGIACLANGDHQAALDAASEACHAEPESPETHYLYGQAWAALGEQPKAERAFAEAIRIKPDWADAWVNYGVARYSQGAIDDAILAMRHAMAHSPDHPAVAANLCAFLRLTGSGEDVETVIRDLLARNPSNSAARLNLATELLQEERSDEALSVLDAVPAPNDPIALRHYHLARALAHLQKGRAGEGRAALMACSALGPLPAVLASLWYWRQLLLALAEDDTARAQHCAEAMEAALIETAATALPEHRIMGHFGLAKFWSGCDAHPRAFHHWVEGHKILGTSQPFSRSAHSAFIKAATATYTRDRFANGCRATNRDPTPVFIVGMPRSGTTLCEQILAAHRDVHGAGERAALSAAFHALAGGETPAGLARLAELDAATLDRAAAAYLDELRALAPDKARVVDKMPANYLHVGFASLMLPGAKVIHCTRDPRDIGLSIFTFRFHGKHPYAHDLADLGWTIAQQEQLMKHYKAALPGTVLTLPLRDWVDDFDVTLARVLNHIGLPHDPACARFYERKSRVRTASRNQVRQPINARGIGRWKLYEKGLAPLCAELESMGALNAWTED